MEYGNKITASAITARIVALCKIRAYELSLLARSCGLEICGEGTAFLKQDQPQNIVHNECLLVDFHSILDIPAEELKGLSSYINSSSVKAFVWTDMDGLETAYALFPAAMCHFLVEASDAEAVMLLTTEARRGSMDQLHDQSRDDGYDELHKISNDLANVARSLSEIVGKETEEAPRRDSAAISYGKRSEKSPSNLADKPVSFTPAPSPSNFVPAADGESAQSTLTASQIRDIIKLRRLRERYFGAELFADPAWDILLDLMAARLEKSPVSVSSLCIAASVPPTTALRWITSMVKDGLLVRKQDPNDARRVFMELAEETANSIYDYFEKAAALDNRVI